MNKVFNNYSQYYNLLYADKNYHEEVKYIVNLLKKYAPAARTILEFGSGTGGHGVLIQEQGYKIYGIERSEEMAKIARSRGLACQVSDISDFKLEGTYDVCMALFHVISYINTNQELIRVFTNAKKHLAAGGFFIFDVWFTPAVMYQKPEVRVKKIADEKIEVTRIATPVLNHTKNTVEVNYEILIKDKASGQLSELKETHSMRHFGIPEIELLATLTGFSVVKSEEFLSGKAPDTNTWGVNFILQSE